MWQCSFRLLLLIITTTWQLSENFRLKDYSRNHLQFSFVPRDSYRFMVMQSDVEEERFSLVTFNILAPCYKRLPVSAQEADQPTNSDDKPRRVFESEFENKFLPRNVAICDQLLATKADIICLQEYWSGSDAVQAVYIDKLCRLGGYELRTLERTSHWRSRTDGLATFVKKDRLVLEDTRDILYHDCGDRVALMLVLSLLPKKGSSVPPQRFICVNTHLLFPHNEYSTKIRLREVTKLLGYVESYKQKELCTDICSRSDVRLPVIIAGDFNGSPQGAVFKYMQSQNFRAALQEACNLSLQPSATPTALSLASAIRHDNDFAHSSSSSTSSASSASSSSSSSSSSSVASTSLTPNSWNRWISHRSHRNVNVAVDHVFYLNPSEQTPDKLPRLPDWTNLVFYEVFQRILVEYGADNMRDVFSNFDQDSSNYITKDEFVQALEKLGFLGENAAALTSEEIDVLIASADKNDDGLIDYKEFYDRFWLAAEMMQFDKDNGNGDMSRNSDDTGAEQQQAQKKNNRNNLMLNARRFAFARGGWLSSSTASSPAGTTTDTVSHPDQQSSQMLLSEAVSMGDVRVCDVQLYPEALLEGVWPEDYTLSDHGMVLCTFSVQVQQQRQQLQSQSSDEQQSEQVMNGSADAIVSQ